MLAHAARSRSRDRAPVRRVAGWGVVLGPVPGSLRAGHGRVRCGTPVRLSNIDIESISILRWLPRANARATAARIHVLGYLAWPILLD